MVEEEVLSKVLNQKNMRPYLEVKLMPDLRLGIKELLKEIIENKELDRHWHTKERVNQSMIKKTKIAELDRKRLEQGSNYESDEEEKQLQAEEEKKEESETSDSYYDSEDS